MVEERSSSLMQASKSPACHRACLAIHAHVSRLVSSSGIIDRQSAEIKRRDSRFVPSYLFLAQLIANTLSLRSSPSTLSPTSLSLSYPLSRLLSSYHHTGNHFRRPVNLLGALVFTLSSYHHVSFTSVSLVHLGFKIIILEC